MRRWIALAVLYLAACCVTHADDFPLLHVGQGGGVVTNYYFASAGSDSANCLTKATACQTISHANSLVYPKNSVLNFNGGDTFSNTALALTTTNAPAGAVTVTSYGTGQATFSSGNSAS